LFISENLDGVKLSLDCAQAEFLTPERAVISLKGGELYVLSILVDGMRSVRGFHFDRAAASVLTTCLAVLEGSFLFLGSRLGNSLLLQFTEKELGESRLVRDHFCVSVKIKVYLKYLFKKTSVIYVT
jgi:cleavage and polyadenylation specificity factor subunit 1